MASLATCSLLFGSTFLVMKHAVSQLAPLPFLALRFGVAALVLTPLSLSRTKTPGVGRDGAIAGTALLLGFVLQVYGLQHTSSSQSAFITYLLVVLVPIMEALLVRVLPRMLSIAGVALALVGLVLIAHADTGASLTGGFGRGEWLTFGCAVAFAIHIVILGRVAHRHDPIRFTLAQLWVVAGVCAALSVPGLLSPAGVGRIDMGLAGAVLYTGIAATALAFVLMVAGQQIVQPSRAALIFLIEPVSAAVFGYAAGDRLGSAGVIGAVCILIAIVMSEFAGRSTRAVSPVEGMQ